MGSIHRQTTRRKGESLFSDRKESEMDPFRLGDDFVSLLTIRLRWWWVAEALAAV